ncbi:F-box/kelch-repeat protein At3g06240-like [Corylus avellana]|uniref:F-box/kelch-repeat protein At3g06240-like n=1 Tax=Corylus avellana TaxID=13451 RepID=UPI00286CDA84|nr:F-box/kelch-repeat protein At3g06240-like [Corylus avellana]
MSDCIPNEVVTDILSRLPVKSLIRFRCVSRTWSSLISSPHLIAAHRNFTLSNTHHPPYLLFRHFNDQHKNERFTLPSSDDLFPRTLSQEMEENGIVGSSNGLLCLNICYNDGYVFWNPSIRKAIYLPDPSIRFSSHGQFLHSLGFGYDPTTDDFKLVRVAYLEGITETVPPPVEIYTLRTGAWRFVTAPGPPYVIDEWPLSVFVNGAVHWLAHTPWNKGDFRNVIVSFDMGAEAFHEMDLPESLQGSEHLNVTVAVLDGLLALAPCNGWWGEESHSVWVMKEYGVVESWTKQFDVDVREGLGRVIAFRRKGEVPVNKASGQLILDLPIYGLTESFYLNTYVESLVLLNVADGVLGRQDTKNSK